MRSPGLSKRPLSRDMVESNCKRQATLSSHLHMHKSMHSPINYIDHMNIKWRTQQKHCIVVLLISQYSRSNSQLPNVHWYSIFSGFTDFSNSWWLRLSSGFYTLSPPNSTNLIVKCVSMHSADLNPPQLPPPMESLTFLLMPLMALNPNPGSRIISTDKLTSSQVHHHSHPSLEKPLDSVIAPGSNTNFP